MDLLDGGRLGGVALPRPREFLTLARHARVAVLPDCRLIKQAKDAGLIPVGIN